MRPQRCNARPHDTGGNPMPPKSTILVCTIPDRGTTVHLKRGLCIKHYGRWWRHQSTADPVRAHPIESFVSRIDFADCWLWTGALSKATGYGSFRSGPAHRWAYTFFVGPIPTGLQIDHLCRVRRCVNPDHMEPVTIRENLLRSPLTHAGRLAAQTHCIHGHEFTPENTYLYGRMRSCRTCRRERANRYYHRNK